MIKNSIYRVIIMLILFIGLTGCFEKQLNRTDFNLSEIFESQKWKKNDNFYSMIDMSGVQYAFYFDSKDPMKNYFSIMSDENNPVYYYQMDELTTANGCNINVNDLEKGNYDCGEDDIALLNRTVFVYNTFINSLKINKNDLNICISDVKNTIIHIEE